MVETGAGLGYDFTQVLEHTEQSGSPRRHRGFFVPLWFAPLGEAPVRKAGGPSLFGCSTSPASALNSAERSLEQRSTP